MLLEPSSSRPSDIRFSVNDKYLMAKHIFPTKSWLVSQDESSVSSTEDIYNCFLRFSCCSQVIFKLFSLLNWISNLFPSFYLQIHSSKQWQKSYTGFWTIFESIQQSFSISRCRKHDQRSRGGIPKRAWRAAWNCSRKPQNQIEHWHQSWGRRTNWTIFLERYKPL